MMQTTVILRFQQFARELEAHKFHTSILLSRRLRYHAHTACWGLWPSVSVLGTSQKTLPPQRSSIHELLHRSILFSK